MAEPPRSRILAGPPSSGERFEPAAMREARLSAVAAADSEQEQKREQEEQHEDMRMPVCYQDMPRRKRGNRARTASGLHLGRRCRGSGSPVHVRRRPLGTRRRAAREARLDGIDADAAGGSEGSTASAFAADFDATLDPALLTAATPPKRPGKHRAPPSAEKTMRVAAVQTECPRCGRPLPASGLHATGTGGRCRGRCSSLCLGAGGGWHAGARGSALKGQERARQPPDGLQSAAVQTSFANAGTAAADSSPLAHAEATLAPTASLEPDSRKDAAVAAVVASAADAADAAVAAAVAAHTESSPRGSVGRDRPRTPVASRNTAGAKSSAQPPRARFSGRMVCVCGNVLAPDSAFCRKCGARRPGSEVAYRNPVPLDYLQTLQDSHGPGRGQEQRPPPSLLTNAPSWPPRAASVAMTGPNMGLDEATSALERLVEETHQTLVRDGLIQDSSEPMPSLNFNAGSHGARDSQSEAPHVIPSLDAVDRALEELQRGLVEIDIALARPVGSIRDDATHERGAMV